MFKAYMQVISVHEAMHTFGVEDGPRWGWLMLGLDSGETPQQMFTGPLRDPDGGPAISPDAYKRIMTHLRPYVFFNWIPPTP